MPRPRRSNPDVSLGTLGGLVVGAGLVGAVWYLSSRATPAPMVTMVLPPTTMQAAQQAAAQALIGAAQPMPAALPRTLAGDAQATLNRLNGLVS